MGFEQLAALKEKLAKQAKAEAKAKAPPRPRAERPEQRTERAEKAPARAEKPVDAVVLVIAKLQKRFPQAFPKNPAPKVPLKIGIFEELVQHAQSLGLSEAELREAIRTWCHGTRYWTCMVEGAARVDLAGQEAGQVTAADAKRAQQLQASRAARARSKTKGAKAPAADKGGDQGGDKPADKSSDKPAGKAANKNRNKGPGKSVKKPAPQEAPQEQAAQQAAQEQAAAETASEPVAVQTSPEPATPQQPE